VHKNDFCDTGKIISKRFLAVKRYLNNVASYLANIAAIVMFSSRHTQDRHIRRMAQHTSQKNVGFAAAIVCLPFIAESFH